MDEQERDRAPEASEDATGSSDGSRADAREKLPWILSYWPAIQRWLFRGAAAVVVLVTLFFVVIRIVDEPAPALIPSPEADALAREMMAAVGHDAWEQMGAVAWSFGNRRQHLWDRHRGFVRVAWDNHLVLLDLETRRGITVTGRKEVREELERRRLETQAWTHWCNDSFWLNPISKLFDEGAVRGLVDVPGGRGLGIRYTSGGATPGDTYLWTVDDRGLPVRWAMWTSLLPIGGVEATWEDWKDVGNGALVATLHQLPLFDLKISEAVAATHLSTLVEGRDPFGPLEARLDELRFRVQRDLEMRALPSALGPDPVPSEVMGQAILEAAGARQDLTPTR